MSTIQSGKGTGLIAFLQWAGDKGVMKPNTANAYKAASGKVLAIDDDWETIDIKSLDVEAQLERFTRLEGANYTPGSLSTYHTRFRTGVRMYLDYLNSPSAFKVPVKERAQSKSAEKMAASPAAASEPVVEARQAVSADSDLMTYPFPLRSGATAYFNLPRDLPLADVERMCSFLKSLALDDHRALPQGSTGGS